MNANHSHVACRACDLLLRMPALSPGAHARCPRCDDVIATQPSHSLEPALAITIAATIALIVANTAPLMELSAAGREAGTSIMGGAHEMWLHGYEVTAAVVAFCSVIAPAIYIALVLTILLALRLSRTPHSVGRMMSWVNITLPWSMAEVMLLGVLVALIKIAKLATASPDIGMYAMGILVLLLAAIRLTFNPREIWKRLEWSR
jgi:paraquat-inducible protein A